MSPQPILDQRLDEIRKSIRDAILARIEAKKAVAVVDGGLADVRDVVYGVAHDVGGLKKPSLWVMAASHQVDLTQGGKTAVHDFAFTFGAFVQNTKDPEAGQEAAEDLAARAYDNLLEGRTLDDTVLDVRPVSVDPAVREPQNPSTYWAGFRLAFRVQRRE